VDLPPETTINTYWKYGPTPDNPTPHWYEFLFDGTTGAEIDGHVITLHFVDGLRGDHDLAANGTIVDPGAPAFNEAGPAAQTQQQPGDFCINPLLSMAFRFPICGIGCALPLCGALATMAGVRMRSRRRRRDVIVR
jgi:hypothetical protein